MTLWPIVRSRPRSPRLSADGAWTATTHTILRGASWLARSELLVVLVIAPVLLAARPLLLAYAATFLIPLLWLLVRKVRGRSASTVYDAPLLHFLVLLPLSQAAVTDISLAAPKLLGLVLGVALLRAVSRGLGTRRSLWLVGWVIVALTASIALVGLVATDWLSGKLLPLEPLYARLPRVPGVALPRTSGGGIHPNEVAGTLALLFPISLAVAVSWRARAALRLLLVAAVLLTALVLVLTQSRMGYLGASCGLLVLFLGWLVASRRRWAWVLAAMLAGASVAGIRLLGANLFSGASLSEAGNNLDTLGGRLELWDRALYMLRDFSYTGIGLGQFSRVLHALYVPFLIPPDTWVPHAHNFVLQVALDLGIPAAAAFFVLVAVGMVRMVRAAARPEPAIRGLALGCLGGLVAFLVFGLGDAIAPGAKPGALLWVTLGLAEALWVFPRTGAAADHPLSAQWRTREAVDHVGHRRRRLNSCPTDA